MKPSSDTRSLVRWNNEMYARYPSRNSYTHSLIGKITKKRVELINTLTEIKEHDTVIEIGCESGELLTRLPKAHLTVGLDISSKALRDANVRGLENVSLIQSDATMELPLKTGVFDVIICADSLEHIISPEKVIERIYDISKPDARIVFSVPNETFFSKIKTLIRWLGLSKVILKNIEEKGSGWHIHHDFNEGKLRELVSRQFRIIKVRKPYLGYVVMKVCKK